MQHAQLVTISFAAGFVACGGCVPTLGLNKHYGKYEWEVGHRWVVDDIVNAMIRQALFGPKKEEKSDADNHLDGLWRAGYGYGNPNWERKKQGLPPVNFNGQVHDPKQ